MEIDTILVALNEIVAGVIRDIAAESVTMETEPIAEPESAKEGETAGPSKPFEKNVVASEVAKETREDELTRKDFIEYRKIVERVTSHGTKPTRTESLEKLSKWKKKNTYLYDRVAYEA